MKLKGIGEHAKHAFINHSQILQECMYSRGVGGIIPQVSRIASPQ